LDHAVVANASLSWCLLLH